MSNEQRYNGWTNYETWLTALWIDNSQGDQEHWQEQARDCLQSACDDEKDADTVRSAASAALADMLKDSHEEQQEESVGASGLFADLLNAAMGRVDWREIAEHFINEEPLWVAGWNLPGCLPDSDPCVFTEFDAAQESLAASIRDHAEGEEDERKAELINELADAIEIAREAEYSQQGANGLVYWINKG